MMRWHVEAKIPTLWEDPVQRLFDFKLLGRNDGPVLLSLESELYARSNWRISRLPNFEGVR